MGNLRNLLNATLSLLTTSVLLLALLHILANALSRHFFDHPIIATNELVEYWYMPVLALVGFLVAHNRNEHIQVSLIVDRLPAANKAEYVVFGRAVSIVVFLGLACFGLLEAWKNFSVGMTAGVTSIVVWPVSFLVPLVFLALAGVFTADIVRILRREQGPNDGSVLEQEVVAS